MPFRFLFNPKFSLVDCSGLTCLNYWAARRWAEHSPSSPSSRESSLSSPDLSTPLSTSWVYTLSRQPSGCSPPASILLSSPSSSQLISASYKLRRNKRTKRRCLESAALAMTESVSLLENRLLFGVDNCIEQTWSFYLKLINFHCERGDFRGHSEPL